MKLPHLRDCARNLTGTIGVKWTISIHVCWAEFLNFSRNCVGQGCSLSGVLRWVRLRNEILCKTHTSALSGEDFLSGTNVEDFYLPEVVELMLRLTGAREAVVHNVAFRRRLVSEEQGDGGFVRRAGGEWVPRRSWSYAWFWLRSAACDSSSCCELAS